MKKYYGHVFIVPNEIIPISEYEKSGVGFMTRKAKEVRAMFPECSEDEPLVEVWMTDPDATVSKDACENWSCHNHEISICHLPLCAFSGKQEGDTISFNAKTIGGEDATVVLTLLQLPYRYRQNGPFESVIRKLVERLGETITKYGKVLA